MTCRPTWQPVTARGSMWCTMLSDAFIPSPPNVDECWCKVASTSIPPTKLWHRQAARISSSSLQLCMRSRRGRCGTWRHLGYMKKSRYESAEHAPKSRNLISHPKHHMSAGPTVSRQSHMFKKASASCDRAAATGRHGIEAYGGPAATT